MNKKLARYYDYIVSELLENTIIDMDNRFYKFPFIKDNIRWNMDVMDLTQPIQSSNTNSNLFGHFFVYLDTMYGVKPQEMMTLWKMYVDRIPK
jgi:hypothetical protein